jgi:DNA-3-methyladenine glycosylase II
LSSRRRSSASEGLVEGFLHSSDALVGRDDTRFDLKFFMKPHHHLKKVDPILAKVINSIKLNESKSHKRYFEALVSAVISQQLSTKAADTIRLRFIALFTYLERSRGFKDVKFPSPEQVLKKKDNKLRSVGLSYQKISYIKSLAKLVKEGSIDFKKFAKMTDEEIIEVLVKAKGIGQWTAEMFLMFCLGRPDVFSDGDLGLKNAIKKLYKINKNDHPKKYQKLVESWSPHRTTAARYLWASLEV